MRKLITALLMLAVLGFVPVLAGCDEPNEGHTHIETNSSSSETHTVVTPG